MKISFDHPNRVLRVIIDSHEAASLGGKAIADALRDAAVQLFRELKFTGPHFVLFAFEDGEPMNLSLCEFKRTKQGFLYRTLETAEVPDDEEGQ